MRQEFRLQDPGEGIHEVDVLDVMVTEGDEVSEGQDVLVVESDKAAVELPSPFAGRVVEIRAAQGDTVTVGDVLLVVEDGSGAEDSDSPADDETGDERAGRANGEPAGDAGRERENGSAPQERDDAASRDDRPGGASDARGGGRGEEDAEEEGAEGDDGRKRTKKASPAARKAAKDAGLAIADITPTGARGQVTVEDVEKAAKAGAGDGSDTGGSRDSDEFGPVRRRRAHSIRAATARAMSRSWTDIPQAVHHDEIDITDMERSRRQQDADGGAVSLTAIVVKAVATLLGEEPRFNAVYDAEAREIVERGYIGINVAVATDRGLVTPVVKKADRKSLSEIDRELADLAGRARERSVSKSDLSGGTFTITNVGALGGTGLVPIVNPPQTAILGLARAALRPVITSGLDAIEHPSVEARMILPMALAFDHRVLDGADAARFAGRLGTLLSEPLTFALET